MLAFSARGAVAVVVPVLVRIWLMVAASAGSWRRAVRPASCLQSGDPATRPSSAFRCRIGVTTVMGVSAIRRQRGLAAWEDPEFAPQGVLAADRPEPLVPGGEEALGDALQDLPGDPVGPAPGTGEDE